jgi:hypothetical protein
MTRSALFLAAALLAAVSFAGAAGADGPASKPAADAEALKKCIADTTGFVMHGKTPTYVTTLVNKCEHRFRCRVDVYVTTARGPSHGHAMLILAPHAAGDAARKSYVLRVKNMGGTAQGSRACKPY